MKFAEIVKDIKSAKEFIKMNTIVPDEVIVVWHEEFGEEEVEIKETLKDKRTEALSKEHRSKTKEHKDA